MGTLYIVPTPLGNLEDITLRALRILKEVSLIACEDTRTTGKLLKHFNITCPMISYYEYSRQPKQDKILAALVDGDVALVSEAGTPLLSDPGYELVQAAIVEGFPVISLPGPSAITTALAASGLPPDGFLFLGFLPRKTIDRRRLLEEHASQLHTLVCFESPHRLLAALHDMVEVWGASRQIAVCRELTKLHEEIWRGTLSGAVEEWEERPARGEFTLVIAGAEAGVDTWDTDRVETALSKALAAGATAKDAVRSVTDQSGWSKRDVYALLHQIKK